MEYKIYAYNAKRTEFENLKKKYIANGEIDWPTFNTDQVTNKEKVIVLTNADFVNGTLRILAPCMLRLNENISFNPNRPTTWLDVNNNVTTDFIQAVALDPNRTLDWLPNLSASNNAQYFLPEINFAYSLGFFAGIAIQCDNVVVDLNNYTMAQHPEHALQQRFYAHIELADQPFMPLQGPSNFGNILRSAINTFICNGTLGRSSHHGIHGNNGGNDIMIENVMFRDFEVSPIALNGFKNVFFRNLIAYNNFQSIPVVSTYSASRFIKQFITSTETQGYGNATLTSAKNALYVAMDSVFNAVILSNGTVPSLYNNPSGIIDTIAYGIVINPSGVAVNQFLENRSTYKANETTNIIMINCNVNNIVANPNEIVAVGVSPTGVAQVDTAGSAFQFFNGISTLVGDRYYYSGTVLSDVQVELAKIKFTLDNSRTSSRFMGTLNIQKGIQDWKTNNGFYFKIQNYKLVLYDQNDNQYLLNSQPVIYNVICSGDSMFHVLKGTIGLRCDGANNLCLIDCGINNISNVGQKGSLLAGNYVKSHTSQGSKLIGYNGAKCYGVTLSAVNNVMTENLQIFSVNSNNASAFGLAVFDGSQNCAFNNTCINTITSNQNGTFNGSDPILPNEMSISRGLYVSDDSLNISFTNPEVSNIVNSVGNPYNYKYDLRSEVLIK